jgi:membrane protein YdbS with pleckstrin-like domain
MPSARRAENRKMTRRQFKWAVLAVAVGLVLGAMIRLAWLHFDTNPPAYTWAIPVLIASGWLWIVWNTTKN